MPSRNLIVISGSSGVGKSTLARALQEELLPEVWLHFSIDSIFYCLPPSIVERADRHNDWSAVDAKSTTDAAYACVRTLLGLGQRIVFDCVILNEAGARRMLDAFEDLAPILVGLTCSWEEIERRTLARGDRTLAEAHHGFLNAGKHLDLDFSFDTTACAPAEISRELAAALRRAVF